MSWSLSRTAGVTALLALAAAAGSLAAQPIDLTDPASVAELAKKKPKPPKVTPILPGIYRLEGTAPGLPQNDLEALRGIVDKASIVALGESIHTSGGYYEAKHRMFRFLVEKMGFRAFAFESPWDNADMVGRYVETCQGSPDEALKGLFQVWQSTEVRDLVQWMCEWNRSHPKRKDKLYFFGFDTQQPQKDGPALVAFLERVGAAGPFADGLRQCDGFSTGITAMPAEEVPHQQCIAALRGVEQQFQEHGAEWERATSKQDVEWGRLRLMGLTAWQNQSYYRNKDIRFSVVSRDSGMAQAFAKIRELRYPKLKTVVWAHNFHIAKDAERSNWGVRTMGTYLRETFGASYVAVALIAHDIEIDWRNVGCGRTDPIRTGFSLETMLHDLSAEKGLQGVVVDLRFPGGAPPLLDPTRSYRFSETLMVPREQFDGAVFLQHSRKMDPLAWPSCK